jgi:hypothetical protein
MASGKLISRKMSISFIIRFFARTINTSCTPSSAKGKELMEIMVGQVQEIH